MKKLIVANWKQLPDTLEQARVIVEQVNAHVATLDRDTFDLVLCPRPEFMADVVALFGPDVLLGSQDMTAQAVELGARYIIIGHSDRRWKIGETDEVVNAKLKEVLAEGITPIVCLGERTRAEGWRDELMAQLRMTFRGLTPGQIAHCLIAYEPVWAISTALDAKPDTPASAVQSMGLIRETLADHFDVSAPTFLYGGSITPTNAADFLARGEISGVLVGGASVRPDDFNQILSIATGL